MTNSGLETNLGRNFTGFDIDNNNYVCVRIWLGKGLLKDINPIDKTISMRCPVQSDRYPKRERLHFGNKQDLRVLIPIQVARSLFTAPNIITRWASWFQKELLDEAIDHAVITMRNVSKIKPWTARKCTKTGQLLCHLAMVHKHKIRNEVQ
jgi:putative ABC transport system permease protein